MSRVEEDAGTPTAKIRLREWQGLYPAVTAGENDGKQKSDGMQSHGLTHLGR